MAVNFEAISTMVHFHRKRSGLTQKQLALLAGVGKTVVFDVENEKSSVRFNTLLKILNALNISIELKGPK